MNQTSDAETNVLSVQLNYLILSSCLTGTKLAFTIAPYFQTIPKKIPKKTVFL